MFNKSVCTAQGLLTCRNLKTFRQQIFMSIFSAKGQNQMPLLEHFPLALLGCFCMPEGLLMALFSLSSLFFTFLPEEVVLEDLILYLILHTDE
jgi:hypothetical protein